MLFSLLLLLTCTNVVHVIKLEDILICMNDTDCNEATDSPTYTQDSEIDDLASDNSSNNTEEDNPFVTALPTETISLRTNFDVTEPEVESTLTTTFSPVVIPLNKTLKFEKKELCECDLTVRITSHILPYIKYYIFFYF